MYESQDATEIYSQQTIHEMPTRGRSLSRRPAKRARSSGSRFSSRSRSASTSLVRRTWPLTSRGMGPKFDPFPAKMRATMRYSQVIELLPTAGVPAPYLFRANSIFDPDFTGTGHQPYGHDQWQAIYNHYNVRSCVITMTPCAANSDQIFGVTLTDDSTVQSDYNTIREIKGTRMAICKEAGGAPPTVTNYFNVNQNFDIPFQKATSASFGQNPSEGMIFHCWSEGPGATTGGSTNRYMITLTYDVDMWEMRDLNQS